MLSPVTELYITYKTMRERLKLAYVGYLNEVINF